MGNIADTKKKTVTLTLTENCNLNCVYCYEEHKANRKMSLETAKKIILAEMNKDDGFEFVYLDFFGGEPFLQFETLKEIVAFVKEQRFRKPYIMFATTNGTLIHGEVQKWLLENLDCFVIGLSLDGTKQMHDINRCNSFDKIDLEFYKKYYPAQGVKMTISDKTLPMLFDGVKFCHDNGLVCNCNLAFGIDWSNEENQEILSRELMKLIDYYLAHPEIKPCSLLDTDIIKLGYDNISEKNQKWCGAGTHMNTYDVDGNVYPCQFFMPLSAGEEKSKKAKDIVFHKDIPAELLDDKCKDCVVKAACPTCYGSNYVSTGNLYKKDDNMCKLTKITLKARSYLRARQWEMGQLKLTEEEEQVLLRSVLKIQNELSV